MLEVLEVVVSVVLKVLEVVPKVLRGCAEGAALRLWGRWWRLF